MTLEDLFNDDINIFFEDTDGNDEVFDYSQLDEAKKVVPTDYERHWVEWPLDEKHYSKKTGRRLYGYWSYRHREVAGAHYGDNSIVHHKNGVKHDNSKNNLKKMSQADHCRVDPNSRKRYKCRICGAPHFCQGLCQKHYMQKFRKGKFGNYDPSKNRSKDER